MLTVVWSSKALNDLDDIVAYVGAQNRQAALELADRIEQAVVRQPSSRICSVPAACRAPARSLLTRTISSSIASAKKHIVVTAVVHAMRKYLIFPQYSSLWKLGQGR